MLERSTNTSLQVHYKIKEEKKKIRKNMMKKLNNLLLVCKLKHNWWISKRYKWRKL